MSAYKDGENHQWENKNITVMLDYKIGSFLVRLKNTDFNNPDAQTAALTDPETEVREFTMKGIFPIRDIINQKPINQDYVVELQLINQELMLNRTILFNVKVTNTSQSAAGQYRVFLLSGTMYNDEMQLPGFVGFENEIELFIGFNAFMNNP